MRGLAAALAVVAGAIPSASLGAGPHWSWRGLHRPLHLPQVAGGSACPVSGLTRVDLGSEGVRLLPGAGPAYPNFGAREPTTLRFIWPPLPSQTDFYGSGWSGNKVLWWVAGTYHGPVLIRGRRLDGPELLRFDRGAPPPAEMRFPPGAGYGPWKGARDRASYTRVKAPGCYAYQIDGTTFSRVIVFEARVVPTPP